MQRCRALRTLVFGCWVLGCSTAWAQVTESVGSRALGMGGAFVAVASDSSATWWNPAALAAGPFLDITLGRTDQKISDRLPARQDVVTGFAFTTPPLGISYYRFRYTSIAAVGPTGQADAGREDGQNGVFMQALSGSQFGVTVVQTLLSGVHAGATLKYVRGRLGTAAGDDMAAPSDLLESADELEGGETDGRFDADVGVLAVAGPVRLGARVRNVFEPEIATVRLSRQTRIGVAFDPELATGIPLTIAVDADVDSYETPFGARRVVALGGEYWMLSRRLGVRAGGRLNTAGARERTAAAGASVAIRSGLYVDAHIAGGGARDEEGWGVTARVSF